MDGVVVDSVVLDEWHHLPVPVPGDELRVRVDADEPAAAGVGRQHVVHPGVRGQVRGRRVAAGAGRRGLPEAGRSRAEAVVLLLRGEVPPRLLLEGLLGRKWLGLLLERRGLLLEWLGLLLEWLGLLLEWLGLLLERLLPISWWQTLSACGVDDKRWQERLLLLRKASALLLLLLLVLLLPALGLEDVWGERLGGLLDEAVDRVALLGGTPLS